MCQQPTAFANNQHWPLEYWMQIAISYLQAINLLLLMRVQRLQTTETIYDNGAMNITFLRKIERKIERKMIEKYYLPFGCSVHQVRGRITSFSDLFFTSKDSNGNSKHSVCAGKRVETDFRTGMHISCSVQVEESFAIGKCARWR